MRPKCLIPVPGTDPPPLRGHALPVHASLCATEGRLVQASLKGTLGIELPVALGGGTPDRSWKGGEQEGMALGYMLPERLTAGPP